MKEFQLLRYLKTFSYLIVLLTALGCFLVYQYADSNQAYRASIVLKYVNDGAKDGQTPAGTSIDPSEIYSASVVTQAIAQLGLNVSVESIRSGITVTEIIPEEEEIRKQALLEDGEEYSYFPTEYEVSFVADSRYSTGFAIDVLNAVVDCYLAQYSTKYIADVSVPQNATNVSVEKYDYIECAQMLEDSCDSIVGYLYRKAEVNPDFRSSQTGYSFDDLQDEYEFIRDNMLQKVYAIILNNQVVKDRDVLLTKYVNQQNIDQIELDNYLITLNKTKQLIQQFGEKTRGNYYSGTESTGNEASDEAVGEEGSMEGSEVSGADIVQNNKNTNGFAQSTEYWGNQIIGDVELNDDRILNTITTYDQLIEEYLALYSQSASLERSIDNYQYLIEVFDQIQTVDVIPMEDEETVKQRIEEISTEMEKLYAVVCDTVDEYNGVVSAKNVEVLTSVVADKRLNLPIYTGLALIIFLFGGCCLAILLGRTGDFLNYFLYIDRKTNLPNRGRCDLQFEKYGSQLLPDGFACMFIQFRFGGAAQGNSNRQAGDAALSKLGQILSENLASEGFIGYNNSGQFIGLFEHCNQDKMQTMTERVNAEIAYLNDLEPSQFISIETGYAISSDDDIYDIRKLLKKAMERARQDRQEDTVNAEKVGEGKS